MSYDSENFSMMDLFRLEVETQIGRLNQDLLALEKSSDSPPLLESLMRAAHSTKGAARLVGVMPAERLAHCMEDLFVAAQESRVKIGPAAVDSILRSSDLLLELGRLSEAELSEWERRHTPTLNARIEELTALLEGKITEPVASNAAARPAPATPSAENKTMRLAADHLDLLVNLAGEVKVLSGWVGEFNHSLLQLKARNAQLQQLLLQLESTTTDPLQKSRMDSAKELCHQDGSVLFERMETLSN